MSEDTGKAVVKRRARVPAERAITAFKVQEIVNLAESKLIKVLKGETSLPERTVVNVALELYKRRVPQKVESEGQGNKMTVIKIVKNHQPSIQSQELEKLDMVDVAVDRVIEEKGINVGS